MLETILNHRTIRKYQNREIENTILDKIIEAGTRASTTGNMQVYSIIITADEKIKEELWHAHFKQDMVKQAPVIMTFCADFNRFNKWCRQRDANPGYDNFLSFYTASIDALLVAQNVAVAAESFGLGICYLGTTTYMADSIIKTLELPEGVIPVTTLVVGYPDEAPGLTDRLPVSGVVHYEKYNNYSIEDIERIYEEKEKMKLYLDLVELNKTRNLAEIFTEKRYTKKDNVSFSSSFLKCIKEQGFMNHDV